ncbi:hypothetical protein [Pararobbsia silviterrae]|uniref:hypothetical protein n=1 Tax=Pararobbsia silviterrae TaxID=1792498 RepID=UPI0011C49327|nr:hypothetical protein [Pararobbsia silviterrae]
MTKAKVDFGFERPFSNSRQRLALTQCRPEIRHDRRGRIHPHDRADEIRDDVDRNVRIARRRLRLRDIANLCRKLNGLDQPRQHVRVSQRLDEGRLGRRAKIALGEVRKIEPGSIQGVRPDVEFVITRRAERDIAHRRHFCERESNVDQVGRQRRRVFIRLAEHTRCVCRDIVEIAQSDLAADDRRGESVEHIAFDAALAERLRIEPDIVDIDSVGCRQGFKSIGALVTGFLEQGLDEVVAKRAVAALVYQISMHALRRRSTVVLPQHVDGPRYVRRPGRIRQRRLARAIEIGGERQCVRVRDGYASPIVRRTRRGNRYRVVREQGLRVRRAIRRRVGRRRNPLGVRLNTRREMRMELRIRSG